MLGGTVPVRRPGTGAGADGLSGEVDVLVRPEGLTMQVTRTATGS